MTGLKLATDIRRSPSLSGGRRATLSPFVFNLFSGSQSLPGQKGYAKSAEVRKLEGRAPQVDAGHGASTQPKERPR
jgi:hypothetical protein